MSTQSFVNFPIFHKKVLEAGGAVSSSCGHTMKPLEKTERIQMFDRWMGAGGPSSLAFNCASQIQFQDLITAALMQI